MGDYGLLRRAASLPHQRRKQKVFKRSLSLSLPEQPGPTVASRFSNADIVGSESSVALPRIFQDKEPSYLRPDVSAGNKVSDCRGPEQHDEGCFRGKDVEQHGTRDVLEEVGQGTCEKIASSYSSQKSIDDGAISPHVVKSLENEVGVKAEETYNSDDAQNATIMPPENNNHVQVSIPVPPTPPPQPSHQERRNNSLSKQEASYALPELDSLSVRSDSSDYDEMFSVLSGARGAEEFGCFICYTQTPKSEEFSVYCDSCFGLFCKQCMHLHLRTKVIEGFIILKCPGDACTRTLTDGEIELHCGEWMHLLIKNRVDADNNPRIKTCPGCNIVQSFLEPDEVPIHHKCGSCGLRWCLPCHAPWHNGLTCKEFQKDVVGKGQKALKVWAKGRGKSNANAVKCPQCKFFIERISGCDHMCCSRCYTDFCYRCGKKHRRGGIFGDHYSRYSFFGCKYNLSPNKPAVRVALRSGVLAGTVVAVPVVAAFVVSVGCVILAVSPIAVPSFLVVQKCRK